MNNNYFNHPADREIYSSRVLNATREEVFAACKNPELLKEWWGPAGFTNTFQIFEFREGGTWKYIMHGPGGVGNYQNEAVFLEIDEPNLIVWDRISQPLFRMILTFEDAGEGRTEFSFRMQFDTKENCDKVKKFAIDKNEENFDRLEALLARQ